MTLATLIGKSKASDAELARDSGLHPTLIWKYRKEKVRPGPENGAALLAALQKHGVAAELADVLGVRRRKRAA